MALVMATQEELELVVHCSAQGCVVWKIVGNQDTTTWSSTTYIHTVTDMFWKRIDVQLESGKRNEAGR